MGSSEADVALRGGVTHLDASRGLVYLQDATGAIAFEVGNLGGLDKARQMILLTGTLDHRSAAPRLHQSSLHHPGFIIPIFQDKIDVLIHYAPLWLRDQLISLFYLSLWSGGFAMEPPTVSRGSALK